jgi:peptide/nickel transport system substrate-binding protein
MAEGNGMQVRTLLGVGVLLGIAVGSSASLAQQKGQSRVNTEAVVRLASAAPPLTTDPHKQSLPGASVFTNMVFDRLTRIAPNASVVPMLATSWTPNGDGSVLEFKLRKDVKFHDGTPFDAAAVKASIERGKTVAGSTVNSALAVIAAIDVVDPHTVRMRLEAGRGAEVPALLATNAGMMISPRAIADTSRNLALNPGNAGSGPFTVAEFEPRSKIAYERAPGKHWDTEAAKAKRIEIVFVQAAAARLNATRAGQFELAQILGNEIAAAKQLVASGSGAFRGVSSYPTNSQSLLLRGDRIPDPRIRKAIQLAINRDAIANGLLKGICTATMQPYPKGHWAHAPSGATIDYDPARARALLKEAGASDFRLEILTTAGSSSEPVAQVIQSQLGEVGIKATITAAPTADATGSFFRGERDAFANIMQALPDPSSTLDEIFLNRFKVVPSVPAADYKLVKDLAEKALNPRLKQAQRAEMYAQIWRLNAERAFVVPICFTEHYWLTSGKVGGAEVVLSVAAVQGATTDWRYVYVNQ